MESRQSLPLFAGRASELERLEAFLGPVLEPGVGRVAFVRGPGGIGKSKLLHELSVRLVERGVAVVSIDARDLPFVRQEIRLVLEHALSGGAGVLIVDTCEERAIVEVVLAELVVERRLAVVLASRSAPSRELNDVVLHGLSMHALQLGPLTHAESLGYLQRRGLSEARARAVARIACGHPLALALCAEAEGMGTAPTRSLDESPQVVDELCSVIVREIPSIAHRNALQICCSLRWTTEEPLLSILGDEGKESFDWLRRLSFLEATPQGLVPHEIAREAILADLRWRSPESFQALLHRTFAWVADRLTKRPAIAPQDYANILTLLGVLPALRAHSHLPPDLDDSLDPARPSDLPAMQAMVTRYEGRGAAALLTRWFERQPQGFAAVRARDGRLVGFGAVLRLDLASPADLEADPATRSAKAFVDAQKSTGPSAYVRWLMVEEGPFVQTPRMTLCITISGSPMFQMPELDFAFLAVPRPDVWPLPLQVEVPEAGFELEGRRYHVLMHDRRGVSPSVWASRFLEAAIRYGEVDKGTSEPRSPSGVTLDDEEFHRAVCRAFRSFHDPRRLAHNPLLSSRLVALPAEATTDARIVRLRELLGEAVTQLSQQGAKGARLARALEVAYVRPAETQQLGAEAMKLSYGTFRRLVHTGLDRVVLDLRRPD